MTKSLGKTFSFIESQCCIDEILKLRRKVDLDYYYEWPPPCNIFPTAPRGGVSLIPQAPEFSFFTIKYKCRNISEKKKHSHGVWNQLQKVSFFVISSGATRMRAKRASESCNEYIKWLCGVWLLIKSCTSCTSCTYSMRSLIRFFSSKPCTF